MFNGASHSWPYLIVWGSIIIAFFLQSITRTSNTPYSFSSFVTGLNIYICYLYS